MQLDYSMKVEVNVLYYKYDKRKCQGKNVFLGGDELLVEIESESEVELVGFFLVVDVKKIVLVLVIIDLELLDEEVFILESGGFFVFWVIILQLIDVFEDLDQQSLLSELEEILSWDLGEGEEGELVFFEDLLGCF